MSGTLEAIMKKFIALCKVYSKAFRSELIYIVTMNVLNRI